MYVQVIYEGSEMKVGPHHAICWRSDLWIPLRFRSGGVHNEAFQTFKTTNQFSVLLLKVWLNRGPSNAMINTWSVKHSCHLHNWGENFGCEVDVSHFVAQ